MHHYLPALFVIGHDVRRLTWEGGVAGTVRGDLARRVLEHCLVLQVHLLQDWDARSEYCRTLSVALLTWQPYLSQLPGCAFAEEACEAMLSRMVGRCRANRTMHSFDDMLRLFATLPQPQPEAAATTGGVRETLVLLLAGRVRGMLVSADSLSYARVTGARGVHWEATLPADLQLPVTPSDSEYNRSVATVLRGALVSLTNPQGYSADVLAVADASIPYQSTQSVVADRQAAMQHIQRWAAERRERFRAAAATRSHSSQGTQGAVDDTQSGSVEGTGVRPGATGVVSPSAVPGTAADQEQLESVSDAESLYYPPEDDGQFSEGYQSFGDTDSLGSVGDLVEGEQADWSTLDDSTLEDLVPEPDA